MSLSPLKIGNAVRNALRHPGPHDEGRVPSADQYVYRSIWPAPQSAAGEVLAAKESAGPEEVALFTNSGRSVVSPQPISPAGMTPPLAA